MLQFLIRSYVSVCVERCSASVLTRNSGAWTESEAYTIYRSKLLNLRSLYTSQLARMKQSLAERRREFILEWAAAGGDREDG